MNDDAIAVWCQTSRNEVCKCNVCRVNLHKGILHAGIFNCPHGLYCFSFLKWNVQYSHERSCRSRQLSVRHEGLEVLVWDANPCHNIIKQHSASHNQSSPCAKFPRVWDYSQMSFSGAFLKGDPIVRLLSWARSPQMRGPILLVKYWYDEHWIFFTLSLRSMLGPSGMREAGLDWGHATIFFV